VRVRNAVGYACLILSLIVISSCGGGSGSGTGSNAPPPISVTVAPSAATIGINQTQTFAASVTNSQNQRVSWSIQEGATAGSITTAGIYTAPGSAGTYHVIATSEADPTKKGSALVTVTAPAPIFSSVPPVAAAEGTQYSYQVAATDPAGTAVTYTLSAAPSGAAINGSTITWIPTQAQSRSANAFTVTARSAAGGTASQQWTVTPSGTINGTRMITYVTDSGTLDVPGDTSAFPIAAYVPGQGGFTKVNGQGNVNGTFTIPNIPAGYYWLKHGNYYYWTNSSTVDTGYDQQGRPGLVAGSGYVDFNVTNARPWQYYDFVEVYSSNANAWDLYIPGGGDRWNLANTDRAVAERCTRASAGGPPLCCAIGNP